MIVTINTDASYRSDVQMGSFAFWITCDLGRHKQAGVLRKKVSRPEIAEFKCIINALHTLGQFNYTGIGLLVINTDCLNVIHLATRHKKNIRKYNLASWGMHLVDLYEQKLKEIGIPKNRVSFRHVPAHKGTATPRTYVNDWLDKTAKEVLKQKILSL